MVTMHVVVQPPDKVVVTMSNGTVSKSMVVSGVDDPDVENLTLRLLLGIQGLLHNVEAAK